MNITQEKTGDLTAEILIHLESADYKPNVDAALKEQAKKASMPGFRPGKVPVGLVRKMVGKSLVIEEINQTISRELANYIQGEELKILGDPIPKDLKTEDDFDINCENDIDFTFEVGLAPELEPNFKIKKKLTRYVVEADDEMIDKQIDEYKERFGDVENPEEAAKGDILYGKIFEADENGEAVEEGFDRMVALNPMRISSEKFFKPYMGVKPGEVLDIDIFKIARAHAEVAKILFMEEDEVKALKGKTLKLDLKKINRLTMAEMNEDFFKKVGGSLRWTDLEELKTEEDFRNRMKEQIGKELGDSAKWHFRNGMQEGLLEVNEMSLPDEFLKKWLLKTKEDYTEDRVESEYDDFSKSVKWSLLVSNIQAANSLEVTSEELEEKIRDMVRKNLANMGMDLDAEKEEEYVKYTMQNQEMLDMHYRELMDEKLFGYLEGEIKGKEKEISGTEFLEVTKKK
ncbi:MAG: trigger factor [Bacteroidota bacterium]